MKPQLTVLTLGVDDLDRALRFYHDGLGFPTEGIIGKEFEHGAVAFFDLQPGLRLALWPRRSLAHDSSLPQSPPSPTELSLGHNVGSREEVDAVMEQAERAGAKIIKPAGDTFWGGYSGYFQDPDGHLWEVVWNPAWTPDPIPVVTQFNQALNARDIDGMMSLMTPDCIFENSYPPPDGVRYEGQPVVRLFWEDFFDANQSAVIEIEDIFALGDRCVMRWVYRWVDPDGAEGHVRGVDVYTLMNGLIAEKLSYVKG